VTDIKNKNLQKTKQLFLKI